MSELSRLLNSVERLRRIYESLRENDGRSFNVFRLCGVDHYETMHSRIIAEFLNPGGAHGLGDVFLRRFVESATVWAYLQNIEGFPLGDVGDMTTALVVTEESYENGRCDITIHWRGWCIVIENKIYAVDQPKQLVRYDEDIGKRERPIIFYLTLDGHEASSDSAGGVNYCAISYKRDVADWLNLCAQVAFDRPYVRESLCQYRNLVAGLSESQKEQQMSNEIVNEITATPECFKSAREISKSMQAARAAVARKVMLDLDVLIRANPAFSGWELKHDGLYKFVEDDGARHKYWHGFSLEDKRVDVKRCFRINCEFQNKGELSNMFCGVTRWACDRDASLQFLRKAAASPELTSKYDFYPEDGNGWLYGAYPRENELRFWTDEVLARIVDDKARKLFVEKLMFQLSVMLEEATRVAASLDVK